MSYFAPYIDSTGVHLPTYEDRLSKLLEDYRQIFGSDLVLTEDTQDYQLCSVFARALDDMSSLMLESYAARDPDLAAGQTLDLLLPLNGVTRLPGETDTSVRLRRSFAIAAPAQSTREHLMSALMAVPGVTEAVLRENDTDEEDDDGLPAHSIQVVIKGGYLSDIAAALYRNKPVGVATAGTTEVTVTDEFGNDQTVRFSRPRNKSVLISVYLKTFPGYDSTGMTARIQTAVADYMRSLKIGQSLAVPCLYAPILALDDPVHPTFLITSLVASASSSSSSERILLEPDEKFLASEGAVSVHTTPIT